MTDVTPDPTAAPDAVSEPDGPETALTAPASPDTRRLVIALVVLAIVAVTAVGFGVVRKKSTTDVTVAAPTISPSTSAPASASASTTTTAAAGGGGGGATCPNWAKVAYTKPTMKDTGVYLYNDTKWHLRVVNAGGANTFAGMITSSNNLEASTFKLSDPKAGTFEVKGNTATFELKGADAAAGLDFSIPCKADQFSLAITSGGDAWPADKITIGKDTKAVSNPVILNRRA